MTEIDSFFGYGGPPRDLGGYENGGIWKFEAVRGAAQAGGGDTGLVYSAHLRVPLARRERLFWG